MILNILPEEKKRHAKRVFQGLSRSVVFKTGTQASKRHKSSFNPFEKLGGKKSWRLVKALSKNPVQPFPSNLLSCDERKLSPPLRRFYSYSLREVRKKLGMPCASLTVLNFFFFSTLEKEEKEEEEEKTLRLCFSNPEKRLFFVCKLKIRSRIFMFG